MGIKKPFVTLVVAGLITASAAGVPSAAIAAEYKSGSLSAGPCPSQSPDSPPNTTPCQPERRWYCHKGWVWHKVWDDQSHTTWHRHHHWKLCHWHNS